MLHPDDANDIELLAKTLKSHATVSDRIRALHAAGWERAKIAEALEKRYQHVWNVLNAAEKHRTSMVKFAESLNSPAVANIVNAAEKHNAAVLSGALAIQSVAQTAADTAEKLRAAVTSGPSAMREAPQPAACDSDYLHGALVNAKQAGKQPVNVSINSSLLEAAKRLELNLSELFERPLREALKQKAEELWLAENREAIESSNRFVEKHGLWSDGLRLF